MAFKMFSGGLKDRGGEISLEGFCSKGYQGIGCATCSPGYARSGCKIGFLGKFLNLT